MTVICLQSICGDWGNDENYYKYIMYMTYDYAELARAALGEFSQTALAFLIFPVAGYEVFSCAAVNFAAEYLNALRLY